MQQSSKPWWMTDAYDIDDSVPPQIKYAETGPKGLALVKVWPDGRTDKGWGLNPPKDERDGFMPRYMRGEFNDRRVLFGYDRGRWPAFAFVMRSLRLVCFDIDGKNGGFEHAKRLGSTPPTLAETSKSGDGYHLFYATDEAWDPDLGYARINDRIGIEQGVDIRGTGCVYHHDTQRWNHRPVAKLPDFLAELLTKREQKAAANSERISKILANNDDLEVLMLHDQIMGDLAKPIPHGKRNVTLFAIGSQMFEAGITDWEDHLERRAVAVGLAQDETDKIIANIKKYAVATP